jgi:transglutaminase-like putative cysteine protease
VGVAWDGSAFVWHEWAEVWAAGRWVAVDPSFGQAPVGGPRFAVARFEDGDRASEAEAGEKVLACWGAAQVETPPGR